MANISEAAQTALRNAAGPQQGAKVIADTETKFELYESGLISKGAGLTRRGTIVRERLVSAQLEAAFG